MQGRTRKKVFCIPEWLGLGAMLQSTNVTSEDLQQLDQELGQDELDVEGEVQALEEQNRLDTEENGDRNENKRKEVRVVSSCSTFPTNDVLLCLLHIPFFISSSYFLLVFLRPVCNII